MQRYDRPKSGNKAEMKLIATYDGWKEISHKRFARTGTMYIAGFEDIDGLYDKKEKRLHERYDVKNIKTRMISGDGAGWVKRLTELPDCESFYQLDQYHIYKAVRTAKLTRDESDKVHRYLKKKNIPLLLDYLRELVYEASNREKRKRYMDLYNYYYNNAAALIPISDRKTCKKLFDDAGVGIVRRMGTMESTVGNVIALRMKNRKASFVKRGALNLARLLCYKRSGELEDKILSLSNMQMPIDALVDTGAFHDVLSANEVPLAVGSGMNKTVSLPAVSNNANTQLAKAIRGIMNGGYKS